MFTETSFPIAIVPLDVCDKLPIPGQFMDTLRAANSSECNQGIYEALLVSYDTFAAEQPFIASGILVRSCTTSTPKITASPR